MILRANENLEDLIVKILAQYPDISASEIFKNIDTTNKTYSLQGIYKELKKLQNEGVVVKYKQTFSLRLPWVLEFVSLADTVEYQYIRRISNQIPDYKDKQIWHFTNLLRLNDFWSQILLQLIQQSKTRTVLAWNPHPWFHLAQKEQEAQFIKALELTKSTMYVIVGGNTFLDVWTKQFWKEPTVVHSFSKGPFDAKQQEYINVIDQYIITVKLSKDMADIIDGIYKKTQEIGVHNIFEIVELFNTRTSAKIILEKNPRKAQKITRQFKQFFGNIA